VNKSKDRPHIFPVAGLPVKRQSVYKKSSKFPSKGHKRKEVEGSRRNSLAWEYPPQSKIYTACARKMQRQGTFLRNVSPSIGEFDAGKSRGQQKGESKKEIQTRDYHSEGQTVRKENLERLEKKPLVDQIYFDLQRHTSGKWGEEKGI